MKYEAPTLEILRYDLTDVLSGPSVPEDISVIPDTDVTDIFD